MAVKLAFTSDLHLPITSATHIKELADRVAEFAPDALAVLGDIGESLAAIEKCLCTLKSAVACPVLVVAGNHDLWLPPSPLSLGERGGGEGGEGRDSLERFRSDLPLVVQSADCIWLEGEAFLIGEVALAGTIAWYDYSAADPSVHSNAAAFARLKGNFNMDAQRIRWSQSDPAFAAMVSEPFLKTLDRLEADPAIRQVVVVTHVPLFDCQMCRKPSDAEWGFSNAYFGNLTLGKKVLQRKKVGHVISGHTHLGRETRLTLAGRVVDARVIDSQYGAPAWLPITLGEGT